MKIFISWSGSRSKIIADSLKRWIPDVIQTIAPWMSGIDIEAGARWTREIETQLQESHFGIICLTKENQTSPWILFETGAIAKTINDTFVCPYLIDLEPSNILQGPLTQFQAKRANEQETWELICSINNALREDKLPEDRLRRTFERCWPALQSTLISLPSEQPSTNESRSIENLTDEILQVVRGLSRNNTIDGQLDKLMTEMATIKDACIALLAYRGGSRGDIEELELTTNLRREDNKKRRVKISIEFLSIEGKKTARSIHVSAKDYISDVLDEIWRILDQESNYKPNAYTYLWDWILLRNKDQLPLFITAVSAAIPAQAIFADEDEWQVIKIDKPLIDNTEQIGIKKGMHKKW